MKTHDYSVMQEEMHGLNYSEIPLEELILLNNIVSNGTGGEESMITILENLIDNSNEDEAEGLIETLNKLRCDGN